MITIDPDDAELKGAILIVERKKELYENADKAWDRFEPSMFAYTHNYDAFMKARQAYEIALINLAIIFMARL